MSEYAKNTLSYVLKIRPPRHIGGVVLKILYNFVFFSYGAYYVFFETYFNTGRSPPLVSGRDFWRCRISVYLIVLHNFENVANTAWRGGPIRHGRRGGRIDVSVFFVFCRIQMFYCVYFQYGIDTE